VRPGHHRRHHPAAALRHRQSGAPAVHPGQGQQLAAVQRLALGLGGELPATATVVEPSPGLGHDRVVRQEHEVVDVVPAGPEKAA